MRVPGGFVFCFFFFILENSIDTVTWAPTYNFFNTRRRGPKKQYLHKWSPKYYCCQWRILLPGRTSGRKHHGNYSSPPKRNLCIIILILKIPFLISTRTFYFYLRPGRYRLLHRANLVLEPNYVYSKPWGLRMLNSSWGLIDLLPHKLMSTLKKQTIRIVQCILYVGIK